jgi:uncharacterized protein DUF6572
VASGVEHPHVLDVIAHDPATDAVTLVMIESRGWSGEEWQLFQLQEKLNAYLSFALDGEMAEAYPQLAEKSLKLQLNCVEAPDERTVEFLSLVRQQVAFRGIDLEVQVTGCGDRSEIGRI